MRRNRKSEAALGVGVLKSFPASRRVRTLKVRTELTSLQSQLHCCCWLAEQFMLRTIYARMLLVRFSEPTPLEKDRTELSAFPCLLSSVRKMQQQGRFWYIRDTVGNPCQTAGWTEPSAQAYTSKEDRTERNKEISTHLSKKNYKHILFNTLK